jgi:hypothetical protein
MSFFTVYIIATCYARQSGKMSFPREPEACDRKNNPAPIGQALWKTRVFTVVHP